MCAFINGLPVITAPGAASVNQGAPTAIPGISLAEAGATAGLVDRVHVVPVGTGVDVELVLGGHVVLAVAGVAEAVHGGFKEAGVVAFVLFELAGGEFAKILGVLFVGEAVGGDVGGSECEGEGSC